jgi:hypothetical protein
MADVSAAVLFGVNRRRQQQLQKVYAVKVKKKQHLPVNPRRQHFSSFIKMISLQTGDLPGKADER